MEAIILISIGLVGGYAFRGLINKELKAGLSALEAKLAAIEAKIDVKAAVAAVVADIKKAA